MSDISKNIKRLRQEKELSQEELAEKLQVTAREVDDWESGNARPDLTVLQSMAEAFGVEDAEVLYGRPEGNGKKKLALAAALLLAGGAVLFLIGLYLTNLVTSGLDQNERLALWLFTPLSYLLLGAGVAALTSVWEDLRSRRRWLRFVLIVAALLLAALYWGAVVCLDWGDSWLAIQLSSLYFGNSFRLLSAVLNHKQFLLLAGFFLFCALPSKQG